ncbi:MAG: alpha/beta hydrolase [Cyclobacteriaceae bacterium]|nr:alpha/beta hydrolase [Cyclobacteriaceae bacterium]
MRKVTSPDNVTIAYEELGNGPALIIIGGSLADHHMYHPLALELAKHFKVYNYDRRNRGLSGTSSNHSVETELNDLETLMYIDNEPKILYAHSAGAGLAIRAAAKGMNIKKLILADLPFSLLDENSKRAAEQHDQEREEIKRLINEGDKEGAVRYFLKDFGMTQEELDRFIASEGGQLAAEISPTLPIDYDILGNGTTPATLLKQITVPTLLLTFEYGLPAAQDAAKYLVNSHIEMLEAPAHIAAPNDIAKFIIDFLKS